MTRNESIGSLNPTEVFMSSVSVSLGSTSPQESGHFSGNSNSASSRHTGCYQHLTVMDSFRRTSRADTCGSPSLIPICRRNWASSLMMTIMSHYRPWISMRCPAGYIWWKRAPPHIWIIPQNYPWSMFWSPSQNSSQNYIISDVGSSRNVVDLNWDSKIYRDQVTGHLICITQSTHLTNQSHQVKVTQVNQRWWVQRFRACEIPRNNELNDYKGPGPVKYHETMNLMIAKA